MLQPPRGIKYIRVDRVRQRKANINDNIIPLSNCQVSDARLGLTLLDLFALGKADVVEDEKRIARYLARLKKDPKFVCEITSDAFETLTHTDLPERRRNELLEARKGNARLTRR